MNNNPILSNVIEHFKSRVGDELLSMEVPEWQTTVYYKPVCSFKDESAIISLHNQGKTVEALVETLITKALTADGKRMFKPAERSVLMNQADPDVILRVATEINAKAEVEFDVETTAKN